MRPTSQRNQRLSGIACPTYKSESGIVGIPIVGPGRPGFRQLWEGSASVMFPKNRVFALMGYEIVESRLADGGISEVRRTNFAPK